MFREPQKTAQDFYKISAQDLKDDKLLKKGEILVKSYYVKQTLPSLNLRWDLSSLFASKPYLERNLFTVLRVGFQKNEEGKILIKTQLEQYPEWNLDFNVSLLSSIFKIYRANYKNSKINISEKLYLADLEDPTASEKIDQLFNRLHRAIHSEEEYLLISKTLEDPNSSVQKLLERQRDSVGNVEKYLTRFETGLVGMKLEDIKRVEESKTETPYGLISEIEGVVQEISQFAVRLPKFLRSTEQKIKKFRIFAKKEPNQLTETDLGFEYFVSDSDTSENEYYNYIQILRAAFFMNKNSNANALSELEALFDGGLKNKSTKRNDQALVGGVYFSQPFIRKILSKDLNLVRQILATMILGPNPRPQVLESNDRWKMLLTIRNNREHVSRDGRDCSAAIRGEYAKYLVGMELKQCSRLVAVARSIESVFSNLKNNSKNNTEVVRLFTQLVDDKDVGPVLPLLMLQVALASHLDENGSVVFSGLQNAIDNNEVEFFASLVGDDIQGVQTVRVGDVPNLSAAPVASDFSLSTPLDKSSVVYTANAYLSKENELVLKVSSVLKFDDEKYKLIGGIYNKNKLMGLLRVHSVVPALEETRESQKQFVYYFKFPIPSDWIAGNKYALSVHIADSQTGSQITEPIEIRFQLPQQN